MTSSLRQRLTRPDIVLAPGVFDALSALLAQQAGFEALYLSGASIAYTSLGRSDVGLTTFTEVQDAVARICDRIDLPLIVDADTGFGNALNVQRTVRGFERAGAAMIQIEDQAFPKRCGHLDGKALIPAAEMCGKLRAAVDARAHVDTLILARTDAVAVEGLDAALERAERYLDAGADALFVEALRTPQQMDAACARLAARAPLLANMVEGGKTPVEDAASLQQRGFRLTIFPGGTARAAAFALADYFASLRAHGSTLPWRERMLDFDALNRLLGTPALLERARAYDAG